MLFFGIITNIFWALVISVILWILCAFAGRLVNSKYHMPVILHLFCFVVAILSIILLTIVFTCNKINKKLAGVDSGIAKLLMIDGKFIDQLKKEINVASATKDTEELTEFVADNFSEKISSEFSTVGKYVDLSQILEKTDFSKQISKLTQSDIATGKVQEIVQSAAGEFTKGIRSKVKAVRRKALIPFILLQFLAFGVVFYKASNYRTPVSRRARYSY